MKRFLMMIGLAVVGLLGLNAPGRSQPPSPSDIRLVFEYPYSPEKVWRALTEPALMAHWMVAAKPEGFSPEVGTHFRFVGAPQPGWSGLVRGEILESQAPYLLCYSWVADDDPPMQVSYQLERIAGGTRFTFVQTGFDGLGGFFLSKLVMTPVREKMFGERLLALLQDMPEHSVSP